jgi:hypothetical protein
VKALRFSSTKLDLAVRRGRRRRRLRDVLLERGADVAQQLEVEVPLRVEVLVEHRLGHAGRLGDVVHGRRVEALRGEHLEGGVQQLAAAFGGRQAGRHRSLHRNNRARRAGGAVAGGEHLFVARRPTKPSCETTRPPEPLRPEPAERVVVSLLRVKARRRRHDDGARPRYDS